jgi:hypothetical protein
VDLGGRGDSPVCGGDDLLGEVDQSASRQLRQRDQSIGSDLAARGPGNAFVARLSLLDRDLGLALGSHSDDACGSGKAGVVGRSVADDVGDVDRCHHAEMKAPDRGRKVDASGQLVGGGPAALVAGSRGDRGAELAGCADQRRVGAAIWIGEFTPAFRRPAPGNLACLERRPQPLHHIVADMAPCGCGFADDACGAGDECLHAGDPHQVG